MSQTKLSFELPTLSVSQAHACKACPPLISFFMQALHIAERDGPPALADADGGADDSDGEGEEEEGHAVDVPIDPPLDSESDHADDETPVLGEGSPKNTGDSDHEADGEGSPVDKAPMSPMSPGDVMGFAGDIGGYDSSSVESSGDESPNEPSGSKGPHPYLPPMPLSDDEKYITPLAKPNKRPLPDECLQKEAKKHKPSSNGPADACLKGLTMVDGFPSGFTPGVSCRCTSIVS